MRDIRKEYVEFCRAQGLNPSLKMKGMERVFSGIADVTGAEIPPRPLDDESDEDNVLKGLADATTTEAVPDDL